MRFSFGMTCTNPLSLIDLNSPCLRAACTWTVTCRHTDGVQTYEHRDLHNLAGFLMASATHAGLAARSDLRPFMLTRSFFAGIQRYASVWTGDCNSTWQSLRLSIGMLQNLCTVGINFCGSDVPGFFGELTDELFIRWYQAAVFFPFMRGHADRTTTRREPWLLPLSLRAKVQKAILQRYEIVPYVYTMFYFCNNRSWPFVMPLWMKYKDPELYDIEDEYMFGTSFLVRPIHSEDKEVRVFLPSNEVWYDFSTGERKEPGEHVYVAEKLDNIPVFVKGGSIIPLCVVTSIASTQQLKEVPIALLIALKGGEAQGYLYLDDGETVKHKAGEFTIFKFEFKAGKLVATIPKNGYNVLGYYKKITILGIHKTPNGAEVKGKEKAVEHISCEEKIGRVDINFYDNFILLKDKFEMVIN
eukprot:TRINITY_DN5617_c0_g1_i11.p1 TRINITY_DN5617_c0_g1~~TRINITY_DN5617_c0_g1_i11.p1  ORF type:complete len:414 (-),score=113.90 TRINITY_DN5617_c0_g1_i11:145-1386(-)